MTRPAQKQRELRQLAEVRKACPALLPEGATIRPCSSEEEEPDLIVSLPRGRKIGIEVTELRDRRHVQGHAPSAIEAARARIARDALDLYRQMHGVPVRLNAYLGPGPYDMPKVTNFIVGFVRDHPKDGRCLHAWPGSGAVVELHASVWMCAPSEVMWHLSAVGETKVLDSAELQSTIDRKSALLNMRHRYSGCDEAWLLIVGAWLPASSDYAFPEAAASWYIERRAFDRVLVFSPSAESLLIF